MDYRSGGNAPATRVFVGLVTLQTVLLNLASPVSSSGQALRYRLQAGERIYYHYKESIQSESMGVDGDHVDEELHESDPEFRVREVYDDGSARMDMIIRNRSAKFPEKQKYLVYTSYIPASEIRLSSEGKLLSGHIYVDDTLRSLTRSLIGKVAHAAMLRDDEVLLMPTRKLWFAWDSLPTDTDAFTVTRSFDTISHARYEFTQWIKGQDQPILGVDRATSRYKGTSVYTLKDTTIDDYLYSWLHYTTDYSILGSIPNVRIEGDVCFRKSDGIVYRWTSHGEKREKGSYLAMNERKLTLQRIEVVR